MSKKIKIHKKVFDRLNDAAHPVRINPEKIRDELPEIKILAGGSSGI